MNHERLIKRSRVIEGRLAGNIFSTVAIDKDENIIGCGCKNLYTLPRKGYVSLFSGKGFMEIFAVANDTSREYKSLTPFDFELMPYYALESLQATRGYNVKKIDYCDMVLGVLYLDGKVSIGGYPEADEDEASYWTDIDDLCLFDEGVLGVTKSGNVKLCGRGSVKYNEMMNWTNIAMVKPLQIQGYCWAVDGFVGLKKDGTLLYCGDDREFAEKLTSYKDVVSFDGSVTAGKVQDFQAVLSDGSLHWYHWGTSDLLPTFDSVFSGKNYVAVKYLPSGFHHIKMDGYVTGAPEHYSYPNAIVEELLELTGQKYDIVFGAINRAKDTPLANDVTNWKLFDDPDEVLRRYEGYEDGSFKRNGKCPYCGGDLKGFFFKKCTSCGR